MVIFLPLGIQGQASMYNHHNNNFKFHPEQSVRPSSQKHTSFSFPRFLCSMAMVGILMQSTTQSLSLLAPVTRLS